MSTSGSPVPLAEAAAIVEFWRAAGPDRWFAKDADFDRRFLDRFLAAHDAAARADLGDWERTPEGALALVILLDQFPRNCFRGTPRMYATDAAARGVADRAIAAGHDRAVEPALRGFFYLPFEHSESQADQGRSVALHASLDETQHSWAKHHREIIKRFGRFPHRNAILGRPTTAEEQRYLDDGGFKG